MKDINKFSLSQLTSNESGKTSGSGTAGLYLVFLGGIIGMIGTVGTIMKSPDVANILLFAGSMLTLGAGLLGYRKSVDKVTIENQNVVAQ